VRHQGRKHDSRPNRQSKRGSSREKRAMAQSTSTARADAFARANAKKRRRLASVGMTGSGGARRNCLGRARPDSAGGELTKRRNSIATIDLEEWAGEVPRYVHPRRNSDLRRRICDCAQTTAVFRTDLRSDQRTGCLCRVLDCESFRYSKLTHY
jgi:hypothetical protein